MGETQAASVPLEIRKYPNRRYYDTSRSRHVTLEDIFGLIREGHEVRVIDSKTEQDITAKVLAQIILELDTPKLDVFPVPLLHRLIRSNEQLVNEFVEKYFNQALNAFLDSQRGFEQFMRRAMGLDTAAGGASWTKMMWNALAPWAGTDTTSTSRSDESTPAADHPKKERNGEDLQKTVQELQKQVAELRQRQQGAAATKRTRSRGR